MLERLKHHVFGPRVMAGACEEVEACQAEVRVCRWIPWLGGLFAGMGQPAAAVCIGAIIVVNHDTPLTRRLFLHELEHVQQWRSERLFLIRYIAYSLRFGYHENPYERAARAAELEPSGRSRSPLP